MKQVEHLEGVVSEAEFVLNSANAIPKTGDFVLLEGDSSTATTNWSAAVSIAFNPTDKNGNIFDFDSVADGDVIRFFRNDDPSMQVSAVSIASITSAVVSLESRKSLIQRHCD